MRTADKRRCRAKHPPPRVSYDDMDPPLDLPATIPSALWQSCMLLFPRGRRSPPPRPLEDRSRRRKMASLARDDFQTFNRTALYGSTKPQSASPTNYDTPLDRVRLSKLGRVDNRTISRNEVCTYNMYVCISKRSPPLPIGGWSDC